MVSPKHTDFTTKARRHKDERDGGHGLPMENSEKP